VTFRVSIDQEGAAEPNVLLERTVTTPDRWEEAPVDLTAFAGEEVTLSLSVSAAESGTIGFWGSPVVRNDGQPPPGSGDSPQGVILIMADTLRRDHLDMYGYRRETAPVLSRMASEGTLFRDNISQASWTKVSTPSIHTSLYPTTHTVKQVPDRLPSSATTLAEVYRAAGYATLSFSSVGFTGQSSNMHQGFEELHESGSRTADNQTKSAREYVDRLLPWLEQHQDVPFFVFLHVFDPHSPFEPRPPYDTLWADPSKKAGFEEELDRVREFIETPTLRNRGMPSREELLEAEVDPDEFISQYYDWYDGSIRGMDMEIGRLLEGLRALNLADSTLVAFIGDHGEEFLDHGRTWHGHSVYGELVNVPLLLWWPGVVPAGLTVDDTVRSIDLMPTLLALSGLSAPTTSRGRVSSRSWVVPPAGRTWSRNGLSDRRGRNETSATDGLSRWSPMAGSSFRTPTCQMRTIPSSSSSTTRRIRWILSTSPPRTLTSSSVSRRKSTAGSARRSRHSCSQTRSWVRPCRQTS
jgi:arylsulfatase A-like enzyme